MRRNNWWVSLCVSACILSGCSALSPSRFGPEGSLDTRDRVSVFGANPLFDNEPFEVVDLRAQLDPDDKGQGTRCTSSTKKVDLNSESGRGVVKSGYFASISSSPGSADTASALARCQLEAAFRGFYDPAYIVAKDDLSASQEKRRNRLQDRLLAASEQRCGAYKIYLRRFQSYTQATAGIVSTIFAGAGAISTGGATNIFAGLAGVSSGIGAEISQSFFANLASYVIVPGIDSRRIEIKRTIGDSRKTISEYTVEAAIQDAASFHAACTLEAGLEKAQDLIKVANNPGAEQIQNMLTSVTEMVGKSKELTKTLTGGTENKNSDPSTFLKTNGTTLTDKLKDNADYTTVDVSFTITKATLPAVPPEVLTVEIDTAGDANKTLNSEDIKKQILKKANDLAKGLGYTGATGPIDSVAISNLSDVKKKFKTEED